MATLINLGSINFTGNWGVVDTTSLSDSEAANTALTASYQESSAFTPGAITVDGIAIKIASRAAGSPSNTITVRLALAGADVAGTPTTMNVSDIDACSTAANEGGWYYFKFNVAGTPTPVLLVTLTAYTVSIKLSATTTAVNVYSAATTNWTRMICTTTTGVPAVNDILHVMGDNLAAGTKNSYTLTNQNVATTSFGTTTPPAAISVNKGGTFLWGTAAATNYYLKVAGTVVCYSGSTWNMGTVGTPMPSDSTAVLEFNSAVNVDSGIVFRNGSTVNIYGATKATVATLMTADKAAAATVITLASTSGWAITDDLAFASTTRTAGDCEKKVISTVDSSTQATLTAGLTNAHSGTSPTQAEVINLTRNVKIRGISASLQGYVLANATSVVNIQYAEFSFLGSATANKKGVDVNTTTGTFIIKYSSFHDFSVASGIAWQIGASNSQTAATVICQNCVFYNTQSAVLVGGTTGTWLIDNNISILSVGVGFTLSDVGGTFTNNTAVGGTTGISVNEAAAALGTFSGNTAHSNSSAGILGNGFVNGTLSSITVWRNNGSGYGLANSSNAQRGLTIDSLVAFGNATRNIQVNLSFDILFTNAVLSGDSTFSTATGVQLDNSANIVFESCTFGVASGIKVAHSSQDFLMNTYTTVVCRNCLLSSTTEVASWASGTIRNAFVLSAKHDQTAGLHKFWLQFGIGSIDTAIFNTASPSLRLTPNTAGSKLESAPSGGYGFMAAVASGATLTVSVDVRKSSSGDAGGANYNGNQQRLIVRKNVAAGIAADTVLATAAAAVGAWETLSGTTAAVTDGATLEFIVDCDGTAGWVNTDNFSATPADTKAMKYWLDGVPCVSGDNRALNVFSSPVIRAA